MKIASLMLSLLVTLATACDGDDPPPGLTTDEQAYCDMLRAGCARQLECGVVVLNQATDLDACADTAGCAAVLDAAQAAGGRIRAADVATCRAAVEAASCESLANTHLAEAAPACATVLEGAGAQGEACEGGLLNGGCQAGLVCDFGEGACPGVCRTAEQVSCAGQDCPDGQFCDFGQCRARAAAGAACELSNLDQPWERPCVDGQRCVLHDDGATSCEPQLAAGATCVYSNPWECVDGFACIDGLCRAAHAAGAECSTYTDCQPGLTCDYAAQPAVCAAPAGLGQACANGVGACGAGLACEEGVCASPAPEPQPEPRPVLAAGASCAAGGLCPLGQTCRCDDAVTCADLHCVAGPALGESCAPTTITTPNGSVTIEDPFEPYACREGVCDFWGGYRCVTPGAPGAACSYSEQQLTLECVTLVCEHNVCVGFEDLTCAAGG